MNKEEQRRFYIFCVFVAVSCICSAVYAYIVYYAMDSSFNAKGFDYVVQDENLAFIVQLF